jgi:hypothetical protein
VTKPSKLGVVVLSLFGLPFLGMGLFAAFSFLRAANQNLAARIGAAVFASVFAIIGGGLIFGSFYGYSRQKKQEDVELAQPGSPWLWRADWAAGRAEGKNKKGVIGWWIGAVLLNMLALPLAIGATVKMLDTGDPKLLLPSAFGLLGLILLIGAIRATVRLKRFGKTYFEMTTLPFCPGSRVAGSIHVRLDSDATHGVDVKLTCFRRVVTRVGNNGSSQQLPLWEDSKNVAAGSLLRGPVDTIVPVEFRLPVDAFQTDHNNSSDQVFWLLKVKADVPGVDYSDEFELPVFRAAAWASPANDIGAASGSQIGSLAESDLGGGMTEEVSEPARHRVVHNDSVNGLEFRFRAGRNVGRSVVVVSLAVAITALFNAMWHTQRQAPKFMLVMVGIMGVVLIVAAIQTALVATRIAVGSGVIAWRRSVLGIGRSREMQISDVESILPVTGLQQASSSGSTLYSLRLKSKSGREYSLVNDIESRQEARWIVWEIEKRAGLRSNTQVAILNSIYGGPPQTFSTPTRRESR